MLIHNLNPVAFEIFFIKIYWYSLAYIFGVICGWIYIKKVLIKNNIYRIYIDDLITYLIIGIIVGGRLGYVLIYNLEYYSTNPLEIFMIWHGGMSFHGGLLGIVISTLIFCKKFNLEKYVFFDFIAVAAPIGILFGRIANFVNSELVGKPTELIWGVIFPLVDNIPRHPSMLYEAVLEGIVLFIILLFLSRKYINTPGFLTSIFLIFYSIFRFIVEFVRVPDSHIGYLWGDWLTMGQLLSVPMVFFGVLLLFNINRSELT